MPISDEVRAWLEKILPELIPQPATAQLENTLEFSEAEKKFAISIKKHGRWVGLYKIGVIEYGKGPYYETIWANNGRPYFRFCDLATHQLWDIFLLPKP